MARRYGESVAVITREDSPGEPSAFTWRGVTYHVRVIGTWRLATRWWADELGGSGETGAPGAAVDRVYFRVQTADQQVFELYQEKTKPESVARWVLDVCLD